MKKFSYILLIFIFVLSIASCGSDDEDGLDGVISTSDERTNGLQLYSSDITEGDASSGDSDGGSSSDPDNGNTNAGVMTAGEWSDLDNWDYWNSLGQHSEYNWAVESWNFLTNKRFSVIVTDANNKAIVDCKAQLVDKQGNTIWEARTNNEGKAELWQGLFGDNTQASKIIINYNDEYYLENNIFTYDQGDINIKLTEARVISNNLDVMFVVDATGSMGDEIEFLKVELLDVMEKVKIANTNLNLKLGSVFYRDVSDNYLTRVSPLSTNISKTINFVNDQSAGEGGDFPEAVETALEAAIIQQEWSNDAIARIMFLILDAPPHLGVEVRNSLQNSIKQAAKLGIRIVPVTASGIDKSTEFLMRFFAISTNGTYVFITDDSGIGNSHMEPTIGEYKVEQLNNLIVRLISEYSSF